ncbi:uncharacterized protein LOC130990591 isoform X2 [Salvia miltiorrhiza]|uniref:uncharacterized protein LOC130990591 isoform X2 n=1 Tax=Salvia miltiorrhiza TaxID=226208 RepID=UPI0025AC8988|nr:uncharacterized protein LOC130990591 isoform X2 [Salvia miltiorrhiza]
MNRSSGGNRRGGGNRGGGRHYAPRGRSAQPTRQWVVRGVGAGAHLDDASSGSGSSEIGRRNSETASVDSVTRKFDAMSSSEYPSELNPESHGSLNEPPNDGNLKGVQNVPETEPTLLNVTPIGPCDDNYFPSLPTNPELNESSTSIKSRDQNLENCSPSRFIPTSPETVGCQLSPEVQSGKTTSPEGTSGETKHDSPDSKHDKFSFDICEERSSNLVKLKTPLLLKNRAKRIEERRMQEDNIKDYRPGMILLKGYLSLEEQVTYYAYRIFELVKLVKSCRDLGRGPGGFYQPGYRDGAKLHLKMMCLGKNWDPETSKYGDKRPADQAKPPPIPDEFQRLVKGAIEKCHQYLESDHKMMKARAILPPMSPNICIINFYTKMGKLGLHKDKDESQKSLRDGLPVVSFSIGDTAVFLYGDEKDVDKAKKVELESGDVLIFGGKSRDIFHGVSNILADTAPRGLLDETHLKPGRLNLTFREY